MRGYARGKSRTLWARGIVALCAGLIVAAGGGASAAPVETVLYSFKGGSDGNEPFAGVIADSSGNLYGTTFVGGASGTGTVFKLSPGGTETVLHNFCSLSNCSDGSAPLAGLIADSSGNLYGTAYNVVFKLSPGGTETVLYSFCSLPGCSDGSDPVGGLIADSEGNLYGATSAGGASGNGVVFKLSPDGTETVLHSFTGRPSDGSDPQADLIADSSGNLYGTTNNGGASGNGVVFKLSPSGTETLLYSFTGGSDGGGPAGLITDSSGNLYGATRGGGVPVRLCPAGCGVVFKLSPGGTETVLHTFSGFSDGSFPAAGLIADSSGNLYGATENGGPPCSDTAGCGVVFKLSPDGTETVLYSFTGGSDGRNPAAGLIADSSGNLYGTTASGGAADAGTVFKLTGTGFVPAPPPAYVANAGTNTVSALNTATKTVVATVTVGMKPEGVAVTPDGQHAYVTNAGEKTVSVIAAATNTVAATVPVGSSPKGVAVTPDGTHAYVTNSGDGTVSVIDTSASTVAATFAVGTRPFGVAFTPDGIQAYVANKGSSNVSVIATAGNTMVATVTVGLKPIGIAVTPDGKHVYVANAGSNNVSVIRTATNKLVATVTVGLQPSGIAISPDGTQAYVANAGSNNVSVIDTATKTLAGTPIPVGTLPLGVAFSLDGKHAYVANNGSGNVSVIRTAKQKVVATVAVGTGPFGIGIMP